MIKTCSFYKGVSGVLKFRLSAAIAIIELVVMAIGSHRTVAMPDTLQLRNELRVVPPRVKWEAQWISAPLPRRNPLGKLNWMWGNAGGGSSTLSRVWFRRQLTIPGDVRVRRAVFDLTADEQFTLFVNGVQAAQTTQYRGANWNHIYHPDIGRLLHPGVNTLAITAANAGDNINYAGLIGTLTIQLSTGAKVHVPVDSTWMTTENTPPSGWNRSGFKPANWEPAHRITQWGGAPWGHRPNPQHALPLFRHGFFISRRINRATMFVSGLGQYDLFINGHKVGDDVMQPGWTDYKKTVSYNAYNVTTLLHRGRNVIGMMLGTGMYDCPEGTRRYEHAPNPYGRPELILQLQLSFRDGSRKTIISSNRWRTTPGPVTFSSIYGGEDYDALKAIAGWDTSRFNAAHWQSAVVMHGPGGVLKAQIAPPVRIMRIYRPVRITHPMPSVAVYDLGQNMAGQFVIKARGPAGSMLIVYPSELLHANGTEWQSCAGPIWCTYTLNGRGINTFHPFFAYYGFRYLQINTVAPLRAPDGRPTILSVIGEATHTSSPTIGYFQCSNNLLNKIHHLITMAMVNNMESIITDCPTREKTGWLEDTYLVGPGMMDNYFVPRLYEQTAANMRDAQWADGMVPDFAPQYFNYPGGFVDSPEWGSACILDPWLIYKYFGDKRILDDNYGMMTRYLKYLKSRAVNGMIAYGLGDWFDLGPRPPGVEQLTTMGVTATATWYRDITVMIKIARVLGHHHAADQFSVEATRVRAAFNRRFYHPATGQYDRGSQCADAMALATGIVRKADRSRVISHLVANVRKHDYHTTAGDIGFHYVVKALMTSGQSELLFKMAMQTTPPSYGYQILHGATSLTEAWNALPADSQDHFMLGHIEEWFFQGLGGIRIDLARKPGRQLEIRPAVLKNLKWVHVSYDSVLGRVTSHWQHRGHHLLMHFVIPPHITARVYIPASRDATVTINGKPPVQTHIRVLPTSHGYRICVMPGGDYRIVVAQ